VNHLGTVRGVKPAVSRFQIKGSTIGGSKLHTEDMVPDGFNVSAHAQDGDGEIGQDDDDLAIINDADDSKVITRSPAKPFQLGRISIFCILINKMIGSYLPLDHQAVSGQYVFLWRTFAQHSCIQSILFLIYCKLF
jgi:hypothetical protein